MNTTLGVIPVVMAPRLRVAYAAPTSSRPTLPARLDPLNPPRQHRLGVGVDVGGRNRDDAVVARREPGVLLGASAAKLVALVRRHHVDYRAQRKRHEVGDVRPD